MDELNNLNPNDNQNQNNSTQGPNPYPNMGFDPNQATDPYASLNPTPFNPDMDSNPYQNSNPYQDANPYQDSNPYQDNNTFQDFDTISGVDPSIDQSANSNNETMNAPEMQNPPVQEFDADSIENLANSVPVDQGATSANDFDNQPTINPILSQNISNMDYPQNNIEDPNMSYPQNNAVDPNMGYAQNNVVDPNMGYVQNNVADSNMGYAQNNFTDPNMIYQNNNFNQSQGVDSDDYNTDFIKNWMGSLFVKSQSAKINWPAGLLGGAYYLYRKMYLVGSLFTVLQILLIALFTFLAAKIGATSLILALVTYAVFVLIFGFSFYPLYKNFVQGKLKQYKQTITDNSQLLNIATTKGNTSLTSVIVFCIAVPFILAIIYGILFTSGLVDIGAKPTENTTNEISADDNATITDIQLYNFIENYVLEYDSNVWYNDEENKSLTKGDYSLLFAQGIPNVGNVFNADVTTPSGRSTLLGTLLNSLETQAAARNFSVEAGVSNFVMGTNAYYGYIDVIATEDVSRYYLVLLPDENLLFQFVLTVNDTTIDYETNLEVVNILTSVYEDEDIETNDDNEIQDENIIENETDNNVNTAVDDTNTVADENEVNSENVANVNAGLSDVLN